MPVFGACFFARSFWRYAKVQRLCERAKGNACFYSLSCEYIYNVRAYIYNKQFIIPSSPSLSSFFFVFLPFPPCSYFANLRPIVQLLANSQIMKPLTPPLSVLVQAFALLFLALYSSALYCSTFTCRLFGQIPASFPVSFPCSQLSTFLR